MELHSSFILAMIIICTPVIFADWTTHNPPKKPDTGTELSCQGWIFFYDFLPDNPEYNVDKARKRNHKYDRTVFLWTASYVYILSRSKRNDVTPQTFCESRSMFEGTLFKFSTLDDEERTCEEWITFYGYDSNTFKANHYKSKIRSKKMDFDISIWAAGYADTVARESFNILLPPDYCKRIGVTPTKVVNFMTYNSTLLTCEEWIKLFDYTDDYKYNYNKAVNTYKRSSDIYSNRWVSGYADDLLARGQNLAIPPAAYCGTQKDGLVKTFYFSEGMMEAYHAIYGN